MDGSLTRPPTAALLEDLRTRRGLSKQRLAELADVSATYVRNIEAGFDESGRQVIPSANVIQKLARGLARAEPNEGRRADEERQTYIALMTAAGYLPTRGEAPDGVTPILPSPTTLDGYSRSLPTAPAVPTLPCEDRRLPRESAALGPPLQADRPTDLSRDAVLLRDRRLARHLRDLLDNWDALASEDQALLLGIAEFIAERRRRRESRD
jgi:transcriptional regulator with XRE-family HTH domain